MRYFNILKPNLILFNARYYFGILLKSRNMSVFEFDKKGGYSEKTTESLKFGDAVKHGIPMIIPECKKYIKEWEGYIKMKHIYPVEHGDYEVLWRFDKNSTNDWILTTDSNVNGGKTKAEFINTDNKTGIFRGFLDTDVPSDGTTKYSGYANIRSPLNVKSFKRKVPYDWSDYTHLILKVRGDGRAYSLILAMDRYFDIQWNDVYQYVLFTRGGPYWQIAKIPFSKFFLASKGRIQDKQSKIEPYLIKSLGLSIADGEKGEFQLEIDFIGLIHDETHREEFHYEMYYVDAHMLY